MHRRALAQSRQDVEQRVAVLAARQADHDLVAGLDHVEVADRLAHLAVQPLAQLVGLERGLARVGAFGRVHGGASVMAFMPALSLMPKTSQPTASQSG